MPPINFQDLTPYQKLQISKQLVIQEIADIPYQSWHEDLSEEEFWEKHIDLSWISETTPKDIDYHRVEVENA